MTGRQKEKTKSHFSPVPICNIGVEGGKTQNLAFFLVPVCNIG